MRVSSRGATGIGECSVVVVVMWSTSSSEPELAVRSYSADAAPSIGSMGTKGVKRGCGGCGGGHGG